MIKCTYLFDYFSSFRSLVERLDSHQALVKQLAKILDGVFKLDEFKMVNSGMSNDISYFRRKSQALGRKMGKENQRISTTHDNIDALVRIIAFYYRTRNQALRAWFYNSRYGG